MYTRIIYLKIRLFAMANNSMFDYYISLCMLLLVSYFNKLARSKSIEQMLVMGNITKLV